MNSFLLPPVLPGKSLHQAIHLPLGQTNYPHLHQHTNEELLTLLQLLTNFTVPKCLRSCPAFMQSMINQPVTLCNLSVICDTVQLFQEFLSDAIIYSKSVL